MHYHTSRQTMQVFRLNSNIQKIKQSSAADEFVTLFLFIFNMQIRFLFCTIEIKYTNRIDAKSKQCEYS